MPKNKKELTFARMDFIQHFCTKAKIDWLRLKVFHTVSQNRNTYSKLLITFKGMTQLTQATLCSSVTVTDSLRCRIAHLALEPDPVRVLGLIFGSRDNREKNDNKDIQNPALWQTLCDNYVNNRLWQPDSDCADCIQACHEFDTTVAPPLPGLDWPVVQEVFIAIRADWTRLRPRVFCETGCHSTGSQLLIDVWTGYINGRRLRFEHPEVTMYVFAAWQKAREQGALPELCNRQLQPQQQLVVGFGKNNPPATPPSDNSVTPHTPNKGRSTSPKDCALSTIAATMHTMQQMFMDNMAKQATTPSVASQALTQHDQGSIKRQIDMQIPEPDSELAQFMNKNGLAKWWPEVYVKLGATTFEEIRFIGKDNVALYLKGLPALPVLKLLQLAESPKSVSQD